MNVVVALALAVGAWTAQAAPLSFQCVNHAMHRDAYLNIDSDLIEIQDSDLQGQAELEKHMAGLLGFEPQTEFTLSQVRLELPTENAKCAEDVRFLFRCEGKGPAELHMVAYLSRAGMWGRVQLRKPVQVNQLVVSSTLGSEGPRELTDKPVSLSLNKMRVEAVAEFLVDERVMSLRWTPEFLVQPGSGRESYCHRRAP